MDFSWIPNLDGSPPAEPSRGTQAMRHVLSSVAVVTAVHSAHVAADARPLVFFRGQLAALA